MIVEAPVAEDTDIPVPGTFEVTPVLAIVALDPGPPSFNDIPAPAARTLSSVKVPLRDITTYSAFVGAPPPPPPPLKNPSQSPRTAILAS